MNTVGAFIRTHSNTIAAVSALAAVASYLATRTLTRTSRRVPLACLPESSAVKNFVQNSGERIDQDAFGLEGHSRLLSPWAPSNHIMSEPVHPTLWLPTFVALQIDVPLSVLHNYRLQHPHDSKQDDDTLHLAQKLLAAFLDARASDPEAFFLDKNVPPLQFTPGHRLFGKDRARPAGAFLLNAWSSSGRKPVQPAANLPDSAPTPVSEFPSNQSALSAAEDAAGAVMYWTCAKSVTDPVDTAASYGLPWRIINGGFQEFIVERVSEDRVRLTYVTVEVSNLHPRGKAERDFKKLPWLLYELHVLYAQWLLYNTVRRLASSSRR
ncbi:hypothetical protein QBC35DRAFT_478168 [Podospora australis]|uniref:Uncharacterized protein n=1 Tax=Podospora australis TaxID=1536484 RepID=A0AAN7AEZ1_9PEZI|nr:hypothetical protein QBC35DRAFT_478168 [Podospora australis]